MQPEALNGIEKGTVFGQPEDQQAVFIQAESRLSGLAVVVGGIIHYQNELLTRIFQQQMLQEGDKGLTVLVSGRHITHPTGMPVVAAKDVQILRTAGGRD